MKIAEQLAKVAGASKKIRPLRARGSLFRAPTMEYVVDVVTRTHQAEVYEMKTVQRPDRTMAVMTELRLSGGKHLEMLAEDQSSTISEAASRIGMVSRLL
jgi:hypothetical protein